MENKVNVNWLDVPGRLSKSEGELLKTLAKGKRVLEVGSLFGRSTVCMAAVAKVIHAVDPHRKGNTDFATFHGMNSLEELRKNLNGINNVKLHICTVNDLWLPLKPFFQFAFIDGSHSQADVEIDLKFARKVVDGLIACHDYSKDHLGVIAAIDAFGLKIVKQVDSIAVLKNLRKS